MNEYRPVVRFFCSRSLWWPWLVAARILSLLSQVATPKGTIAVEATVDGEGGIHDFVSSTAMCPR